MFDIPTYSLDYSEAEAVDTITPIRASSPPRARSEWMSQTHMSMSMSLDDLTPPLLVSARKGDVRFIKMLVRGGADPNQTWERGLTPLLQAVKADNAKETVECLLDLGGKMNHTDKYGNTALSLAIQRESYEAATYLVERGADVTTCNNVGATPLMYAARRGHAGLVEILLAKGARINRADVEGNCSLSLAVREGYEAIVELLLVKGADPKVKDKNGRPLVYAAIKTGNPRVVKLLADAGADVESSGSEGMATPIQYARSNQQNECAEIILKCQSTGRSSPSLSKEAVSATNTEKREAASRTCVVS